MGGEWKTDSLERLIDVKHGYAFGGEHIHDAPSGDVLLTPGNFAVGGGFKDDKFKYYDGSVPAEFVLREGDLIVTMTDLSKQSDTLGYPAFVPSRTDGRRYLHNQRLGKISVKDWRELDIRFLRYLLCSDSYRNEVLAGATGTTVKHTSPERIRRFTFSRPPLTEQRAIAHILGTLDDKIDLNRQMSATLEAMARALFESWFVRFDPVRAKAEGCDTGLPAEIADLFPDRFEESEIGEVPKGWRVGGLRDIAQVTMGQSPPGETYNDAGSGLPFYQGKTDFGSRFPTRRIWCSAPTRFADAIDVLVSVRAPVGSVNIATERCAIGRGLASVKSTAVGRSYLFYSLLALEDQFSAYEAGGTVFGSINKEQLGSLAVTIAPPDVLDAFEQHGSGYDSGIHKAHEETLALVALRDTLLPKLVSGDLRVPDAERVLADAGV
jgi:type I restriction enzyme, S subunit